MDHRALMPTLLARAGEHLRRSVGRWIDEEPPGAAFARGALPPTLAEQQRLVESRRLSDFLPYEAYDPEQRLYHNADSLGFLLEVTPAVGLDDNRLGILTGLITQGIRSQTAIQLSMWADPDIHPLLDAWWSARERARGPQAEALRGLARRRVAYLRDGAWTSLFSDQPMVLRDWRLFIAFQRPRFPGSEPESDERDYLCRTRDAYRSTLQSAGMPSFDLPPSGLIRLIDGLVNPTSRPRGAFEHDERVKLCEQMADRDSLLLCGRDALSIAHDGRQTSVLPFSVRQYPRAWAGWGNGELLGSLLNNVLRLPCPALVTQTIVVDDPVAAVNQARLKSARATQMRDAPIGRYVPAWKDRAADWDFVIRNVGEGHKLLRAHYQVVAFAPAGEEEHCEQKVRAIYDARGWSLQKDRFCALHALRAALPMTAGPQFVAELRRMGYLRSMLTWSAINTAPLIGEWKGTGSPLLLLIGRRGQLQFVDPFDNRKGNFNIACAATSGAGKSFLSQEMIASTLTTGGRVWVIDAGRSYQNLCSILGGSTIDFARQARPVINPFSGVHPEAFETDELPILKQILARMCSPQAPLGSLQLSYLEQGIAKAWAARGRDTEITDVADVLAAMPHPEQTALAVMLHPWTRAGSYGRYFAGATNIDLDSPFVVLELDDLNSRPDLQSVVLMIVMLRITETMYLLDRSQRKLCIIDEAWRLLGAGMGGDFIESGYRTARKYGGAFMTITQGIDDYYKSASATAALDCSDWVFLLRQKPESIAAAAGSKRLFLDEGTQQLLLSVDTAQGRYSEIAIRGPGGLSVGRLVVDPFTEKLYSTQAAEFQFVQDALAAGRSIDDAVEALVQRSARR